MPRAPGAILRHLEQLYNHGTATGLSEPDLLNRFLTHRDETAFVTLVARYGPMILGVCRRNLVDERDVEDAFQATFLIFVRRAHTLSDPARLGPWLHGVAHRVAVRAKAQAAQRHRLEPTSAIPADSAAIARVENTDHQELTQILDTELARLPSNLRAPIILCYLEGLTHDQAAQRLHWPVGTVRSRMTRARSLLKTRLARRGITPYTLAIATALTRQPVSISLIERTIQFSLALGSPKTLTLALTTIPAAALAKGVLQTMFVTKTATVAAITLSGILAFGTAGTLARHLADNGDQSPKNAAAPPVAESPKPDPAAPDSDRTHKEVQLADRIREMVDKLAQLKTDGEKLKALTDGYEQKLKELIAALKTVRQGDVPPAPAAKSVQEVAPKSNVLHVTRASGTTNAPKLQWIDGDPATISADGRELKIYYKNTNSVRVTALPALIGQERRFLGVNGNAYSTNNGGRWVSFVDVSPMAGTENMGKNVEKPIMVHRIAGLRLGDGQCVPLDLPRPTAVLSASNLGNHAHRFGDWICAFSPIAMQWGVLELEGLADNQPINIMGGDRPSCVYADVLYQFIPKTGEWISVFDKLQATKASEK